MRDREFIQRTHRARYKQHHVTRSDQHDVSTLQTETRVDQRITCIERQLVKLDVLELVTAGRYPHVKTARVVGSLSHNVNDTGRRTRK